MGHSWDRAPQPRSPAAAPGVRGSAAPVFVSRRIIVKVMLSQQFIEEYALRVPIRKIKPFMAGEGGSVTQTKQRCPCFILPALRLCSPR